MVNKHEQLQARLMARAMKEHLEDPHPGLGGVRLRVHVATHAVVETQLSTDDPPETAAALQRLMDQGSSRHEAIHAIATVVSEQLIHSVGESGFDEQRFRERLSGLEISPDRDPAPA